MHSGEFTYLEKMMMIAVLPDNKLIAVFNLVIENERLVLFFFFFSYFFFFQRTFLMTILSYVWHG